MTSVSRILAVWLTPAVLLAVPAALATSAADGLWLGLTVSLVPLITLGLPTRSRGPASGGGEEGGTLFPVVTLLLAVGVLLWANIALAGDVAAWLGRPRWQGIAITAALGWLLTAWRPLRKTAPLLLAIALIAAAVPLLQIGWASGLGPIAAWDRVATQPAFRFPPSSPWVTTGRELGLARGTAPLVFDEVHRLTAPAGGALRARTLDGTRLAEIEWTLGPGQVITLRAGDELSRRPSLRLRFEADKHVPGAPPSGVAWADDRTRRWLQQVGLLVTLLVGSAALLRAGLVVRLSRDGVGFVACGLLVALVWAEAWAVYTMLNAPDALLGGITLERLLELPAPTLFAEPWRRTLQGFLLIAALAAFLASSVALRERLGALDPTGGGEIGRDPGLWAGLFGGAALASLWPVDPWTLTLLALGGAGCALGPATLAPPRRAVLGTTAGVVGLVVFAAAAAAQLRDASGVLGAVVAYPALAGAPAGALLLWLGRTRR